MAENLVLDPVTRIEGHLRVEAVVENGKITDAWATGTLYRGVETVLQGRRPEDAFYVTQRICGVCPTSHGHASSMAVESAYGIKIPNGARLVRNIYECAENLHSHILWFYILAALDYVNPAKALTANISDTIDLAKAAGTGISDFAAVQERVLALVQSGDMSVFSNGWWGIDPVAHPEEADELYNPDMPAELHLIGVAHYLEALEMQAEAARVMALLGGKFPHGMTSVAGGTAWVPDSTKLDDVLYRVKRVAAWVDGTMIPDVLAIAPFYTAALEFGGGCGKFLSFGLFNDADLDMNSRYFPAGYIDVDNGLKVDTVDTSKIKEYVKHAWYTSPSGLHPQHGETQAISSWNDSTFDLDGQYTWAKAPRYDEKPAEVGPLSRMLVGYLSAGADPAIKGIIDFALGELGVDDPTLLVSLLGRVAARVLETKLIADQTIAYIVELVEAVKTGEAKTFAEYDSHDGEGAGFWEAPRGALAHFVNVKNGRIENYNVVTPSTWDMSPRDDNGVRGPLEEALVGTPIDDIERPIMAARVARSFDP
ncbi:MAG: nickel-dependent hydrogenase large subunit [Coriobacteriia bacterium]|nr:nickel-dependent hydrogenase large subunit [Coriobacteriia bacterium]